MGNTPNMDPCRFFLDLLQRPPSLNKHVAILGMKFCNTAPIQGSSAADECAPGSTATESLSIRPTGAGTFWVGQTGGLQRSARVSTSYVYHTYHRFIYVELRWIFSAHQGYHKVMTEATRICCLPFIVEPPIRNPPQNVRITCLQVDIISLSKTTNQLFHAYISPLHSISHRLNLNELDEQ